MQPNARLEARISRRQFLKLTGLGAAAAVVAAGTGGSNPLPAAYDPTGTDAVREFVSRPDLKAPVFTFAVPARDTWPGLLFLTPDTGPLIMDDRGEPIWIGPGGAPSRINLHATEYGGKPVLAWWEGTITHGHGEGEYVMADTSYRELLRFGAGHGVRGDLHEMLITPAGTALITAFATVTTEGRPLFEGVVQEIDIASGDALFEWHSYPVVPEDESVVGMPADPKEAYDYFHVNSVDVDADGNLLVSARNTSTVYKLDRSTGAILWRLGGSRSDFVQDDNAVFRLQHDARRQPDGTLSIFDDESGGRPARAVFLRPDLAAHRAVLVREYPEPAELPTPAQGSVQPFPDGSLLVGWGSVPELTEFAADGSVRMHARFDGGKASYRVRRSPWKAVPHERPVAVARADATGTTVYASWNGATEVASWQVLAGETPGRLDVAGTSPRTGFETAVTVATRGGWFAARALDAAGNALAESPATLT